MYKLISHSLGPCNDTQDEHNILLQNSEDNRWLTTPHQTGVMEITCTGTSLIIENELAGDSIPWGTAV
jgi:hypothetical protein